MALVPRIGRWRSDTVAWPRAREVEVFADIRQVFDKRAKEIDALIVSDYDHFHGVACGAAMRAGKAVCSERPVGLRISDARALRALAAETKLPTTYRSPGHRQWASFAALWSWSKTE